MNEQLLKWAKEGYAPTLLYDDNGHWAISFCGMLDVGNPSNQSFTSDFSLHWRDTPQSAVYAVVGLEDDL